PNALRDYFRDIGRMVLAAEGRKANDSHADCYQYFCVPEYGTANGRLHFHAVHFMRTQIGRASCRERVEIWVGAVSLKKTDRERDSSKGLKAVQNDGSEGVEKRHA